MASQSLKTAIQNALNVIAAKRFSYKQDAPEPVKNALNNAKAKEEELNPTIADKWTELLTQKLPQSSDFINAVATALLEDSDFIDALKSIIKGG